MSEHSTLPPTRGAGVVVVSAIVGAVAASVVILAWQPIDAWLAQRHTRLSPLTMNPARMEQGLRGLLDEEAATIAVVRMANASVVSIGAYREGSFAHKEQIGGGTGFVIDNTGLILTNRHVVDMEHVEYRVILTTGTSYPATVVGRDTINDVAIIRIDAPDLQAVTIGDSDAIAIGQTVIAVGNAFSEFENSVTRGIISGVNRHVVAGDAFGSSEVIEEAIQTDAAINPGNSGGPLLNLRGEVVGMNTAVSQQGQSVGFAIPINATKRSVESVHKYGRIVRTWLGVRYVTITPELQAMNKLPVAQGALINAGDHIGASNTPAVIVDSPAAKAGLRAGDIITRLNGDELTSSLSLPRLLSKYWPGDTISITFLRDGKTLETKVTVTEFTE